MWNMYRKIMAQSNGYFGPDGVPYHSVETLMIVILKQKLNKIQRCKSLNLIGVYKKLFIF